jgi:hypothetical protein
MEKHSLKDTGKHIVHTFSWVAYFFGAHAYDVFCFIISNSFGYTKALAIMFIALFIVSILLVWGHAKLKERSGFDLLGIEKLTMTENETSSTKQNHLHRWILSNRTVTFWIGSIIIGPPIITLLLRKSDHWKQSFRYIFLSTMLTTLFWVSVYTIGIETWKHFIEPFIDSLLSTIYSGGLS